MRMRPLVLLLCLSLPLAGLAPVSAKKGVAFPDGTWKGTAVFTGSITKSGMFATGSADIIFTLKVSDGQVVGGVMKISGAARSRVPGGGRANLKVAGGLGLGGTAGRVTVSGPLSFSGTASAQGFTVPVEVTFPASGGFSPVTASCAQATGDLATETRQVHGQFGFASTVQAKFVAVRVADADVADVVGEYKDLVEDIHDALAQAKGGSPPTVQQLRQLASRVAALHNAFAGLKGCGDTPEGFEKGVADPFFSDLFRALCVLLLERADQLTVSQLISLAYLAYETGAMGASSADPQAGQDLEDEVALALNAKLDFAVEDGDTEAILSIYSAAQQLGLDDVAAKAKSALGGFIEEGESGDQET